MDYAVLVRNLVFLGLIAIMPFPVRLLSDYSNRPLAVAIYYAPLVWVVIIPLRLLAARLTKWPSWRPTGT